MGAMRPRSIGAASVALGAILSSSACGLVLDSRPADAASGEDAALDAARSIDAASEDAVSVLDATSEDAASVLDGARVLDASSTDAFTGRDAVAPDAAAVMTGGCFCGDGLVGPGEQCDVAGAPSDGCSADCQLNDGFVCHTPAVSWLFPSAIVGGPPGAEATQWKWSAPMGTPAATYETDEVTCIPRGGRGYLLEMLPVLSAYDACAQWISNAPRGCGSATSSGTVIYATEFSAPSRAGRITLGLGWDNFLVAVRLDGVDLLSGTTSDGWTAPRAFVSFEPTAGRHRLEIVVQEVGTETDPMNNNGISVMQASPSICTPL